METTKVVIIIFIACTAFSSTNTFSTSQMINYVYYEDQQYAENKYLEMGPMRHLSKLVYKSVPINESSICEMDVSDAIQVCGEIATYKRTRGAILHRYKMHSDEELEECKEYSLKLAWDYRLEKKIEKVRARKCPTKPTLWMSDGKNTGSVFVYARNTRNRRDLKLIDYIIFKQRVNGMQR